MKTITISLQDDIYERAEKEARRRQKSLPELLRELMSGFRGAGERDSPSPATTAGQTGRQQWLSRLREIRSTVGAQTGPGPATNAILDDLRADRF